MEVNINGIRLVRGDRRVYDSYEMNKLFCSIVAQADKHSKNVHYR